MPKESGLGLTVAVDDAGASVRAIGNCVTGINWSTPRGTQEITGVCKAAMERLLLLADGQVSISGVFNPAANLEHAVFSTVGTTSVARTVTIVHSGQTLAMEILFSEYVLSRANDGAFTFTATGALATGAVPTWSA